MGNFSNGKRASDPSESKALRFLYNNALGRICLKALNKPFSAKIVGAYMDSRLSARRIKKFVDEYGIDMSLYEQREFKSYNDFFTRRMLPEHYNICADPRALIAPCDSRLTVYPLDAESVFYIKGSPYDAADFLQDEALAKEFEGGLMLVFRLSVDNYHRYCYFDSGTKGENIKIKGVLHTVQPVALGRYNYYKHNSREYTVMQTESFGKAIQAEIGAMFVGKIVNHASGCAFRRGEEKGYFEFGGSTVAVMLRKGAAEIFPEILAQSLAGEETPVRIGERIGFASGTEGDLC